jgi:peptidoglycan/xylan/chitin deacetylase (PgdA/CDA1 family)
VRRTAGFVAVVAQPGDTLAGLAGRYLGDAGRDWEIAEFNGVQGAVPGEALVIPLAPPRPGGLRPDRYQTVPVLSYHNFAEKGPNAMTVTREAFEAQMDLLARQGYRVISLDQLYDFIELRAQVPEKSVVITVDDGWRSFYDIAWPVLRRHGYPATLFVYTQLVSGSPKTLSWEQLREMAAQGLDVECHTISHRDLGDLSKQSPGESTEQYLAALQREVGESLRIIEEKLGRRPRYLAYPYGSTNGFVVALLRRNGYRGALTVERGPNAFFFSGFRLNRSMVYGDFDLARFERNLGTAERKALR